MARGPSAVSSSNRSGQPKFRLYSATIRFKADGGWPIANQGCQATKVGAVSRLLRNEFCEHSQAAAFHLTSIRLGRHSSLPSHPDELGLKLISVRLGNRPTAAPDALERMSFTETRCKRNRTSLQKFRLLMIRLDASPDR
ncbi:hypothetical protein [Azospirillum brasilense]|uniref:hypothetical protein n=1 Tax=Azospirillum brasilense TaxID=192 RepID=UPI0010C09ACB|nr:hypothetical protein [Azospirillum brasilense]